MTDPINVTPLDAYAALKTACNFTAFNITRLRQKQALKDLTPEVAIKLISDLMKVFDPSTITALLLKYSTQECLKAASRVEDRMSLLTDACGNCLGTTVCVQIITQNPGILFQETERFIAQRENLIRLIPGDTEDRHRVRAMFLAIYPAFFSLPPLQVVECIRLGITLDTLTDLMALYNRVSGETFLAVLTGAFRLIPADAKYILESHPALAAIAPNALEERIRRLTGTTHPTSAQVNRLLRADTDLVIQDTRGMPAAPPGSDRVLTVIPGPRPGAPTPKVPPAASVPTLRHIPVFRAMPTPPPAADAQTPVPPAEKPSPWTDAVAADSTAPTERMTPPVKESPAPAKEAPSPHIRMFCKAKWNALAAGAHLKLYPWIKDREPQEFYELLMALHTATELTPRSFPAELRRQAMAYAQARFKLRKQYEGTRMAGNRQSREIGWEALRLARVMYDVSAQTVQNAAAFVRNDLGFPEEDAREFLGQHLELLAHNGQALRVLRTLLREGVAPEAVLSSLRDPRQVAVLLEESAVFLRYAITRVREIIQTMCEYLPMAKEAWQMLDVTQDWSRAYFPAHELACRAGAVILLLVDIPPEKQEDMALSLFFHEERSDFHEMFWEIVNRG